jgi:hypothetical protein
MSVAQPLRTGAFFCLLASSAGAVAAPPPAATSSDHLQTRFGPVDIVNGYPTEASVKNLYDELDFQRAVQAYVWATPLVSMEALRQANAKEVGVGHNTVGINDEFTTPSLEALTANNTTIYACIVVDLRNGPVVIDSPKGAYGVVDDFWQRPVTEVGPFGPDKGNGGKFLILPPGYTGEAPPGYFAVHSLTNQVFYLGRASVENGNIKGAVDTLGKLQVYPLSAAGAPPRTKIIKIGGKAMHSVPPSGLAYWELLSEAINNETIEPRDRFFYAMLKPLGIEKGKPFKPDARQQKILSDAAALGFRMSQVLSMVPRNEKAHAYPGTQWDWVLTLDPGQEAADYSQLDERTDYTFEAITVAAGMVKKIPGAGSQYMSAARDKNGQWLDGGKSYRLRVPAQVPVKDFWAVTVYDNMSRSMVRTDTGKAGVDSKQANLQKNDDGTVDVYFGPTAPAGHESNWVKTMPSKGWFAYFRWYGPTAPFFDQSWKLPDIEPSEGKASGSP